MVADLSLADSTYFSPDRESKTIFTFVNTVRLYEFVGAGNTLNTLRHVWSVQVDLALFDIVYRSIICQMLNSFPNSIQQLLLWIAQKGCQPMDSFVDELSYWQGYSRFWRWTSSFKGGYDSGCTSVILFSPRTSSLAAISLASGHFWRALGLMYLLSPASFSYILQYTVGDRQ